MKEKVSKRAYKVFLIGFLLSASHLDFVNKPVTNGGWNAAFAGT